MSEDHTNNDRFFHLASLYLDALTTHEEAAELAQILRNSPQYRSELARMIRIHGALTQRGSVSYDQRSRTAPKAVQARRGRLRTRSRHSSPIRFAPLALAAAALLTFALLWVVNSGSSNSKQKPVAVQNPNKKQGVKQTPKDEDRQPTETPVEKTPKTDVRKEKAPRKLEPKKIPKPDPQPEDKSLSPPKKVEAPKKAEPNPEKKPEPKKSPRKPPRSIEKQSLGAICQVVRVIGSAKRDGQTISAGTTVKTSTQLRTDADSFLTLSYSDGSLWELGPQSQAQLSAGAFARFNLVQGSATLAVSPQAKDKPFQLETRHSQIKVLGTQFKLHVNEKSTTLEVLEGKVRITRKKDGKSLVARARDRAEVGQRIFRKRRLPKVKRRKNPFLFREDFETLPVNKWPKSFRAKNTESSGFVTSQRNKNKFMTAEGSNQIQRAYLPFDKFSTPFTIQFRVRLTGKENSRIGLNLWNETDKQRYAVAYDHLAGLFKVYRGKAGKPLASRPVQLTVGAWHNIKVTIAASGIEIFASDRPILSATTPVAMKISAVSLVTLGKHAAQFDDVSYSPIPAK